MGLFCWYLRPQYICALAAQAGVPKDLVWRLDAGQSVPRARLRAE